MRFEHYLLGINAKWFIAEAAILVLCYGLSHLARAHWALDLLSHFLVQYAFFAFVFFFIFIVLKMPLPALIMLAVCAGAVYETRTPLSSPWKFSAPPGIATDRNALRVAQYNKHYDNKNYQAISRWLNDPANGFDIVFLLEVEPEDAEALRVLTASVYPHTLPESGIGPDFSLILLRHKPLNHEEHKIAPDHARTRGVKFEIQPDGFAEPVTLYNFHTRVPVGQRGQERRNAELRGAAAWIASDPSERKIAVGDWNITPYSPYFSDFVRDSKLTYQTYGGFPPSTWVSYFTLPFLKIPIDHMLYGQGLELHLLEAGPSFGSDHQALTGVFISR